MPHPTTRSALTALFSAALAACGGSSQSNDTCPPGYTCTPDCAQGGTCNDDAGGADSTAEDADGGASDAGSYPEGSAPPTSATVNVLSYDVVDAKFSTALSALILVSTTPSNALHIYDVTTAVDRVVPLPEVPVAVAIDAAGTKAAVAYDAHVSSVDLQAGVVDTTCALTSDAFDVVLSSAGEAYVVPATQDYAPLHAVDFATCFEDTTGAPVVVPSHLALAPDETDLFVADLNLDPQRITRCDVSVSPISCADSEGMNDFGTYPFCGRVWVSADGQRVYSACSTTLLVPTRETDLCQYGGSISGVSQLVHMSEAPQAQRIVLIPHLLDSDTMPEPNTDTVLRIHDTQYLALQSQIELPPFPLLGGTTTIGHGLFVFTTPTMDTLYVVLQADASSSAANAIAIATISP